MRAVEEGECLVCAQSRRANEDRAHTLQCIILQYYVILLGVSVFI